MDAGWRRRRVEGIWLVTLDEWGRGEACRGRSLWRGRRPGPRLGNGCSVSLPAPRAGKACWPRPRPGGRTGPPLSSLADAGLRPEPRNRVGSELPVWLLGGGSLRRNMALVGNGTELEADEVLAGWKCVYCSWTSGGMSEPGRVRRARQGQPRSRPLGSQFGTYNLPLRRE